MPKDPQSLIDQLRQDLVGARKARDMLTTDVLRSTLNSIDNASAVPVPYDTTLTEVPRRELTLEEIIDIIKNEIIEMQHAADQFNGIDNPRKDELNKKILLLQHYLHTTI